MPLKPLINQLNLWMSTALSTALSTTLNTALSTALNTALSTTLNTALSTALNTALSTALTTVCLSCSLGCGAELPQGVAGPEAERLATKMLEAVAADGFWLAEGARWRFMSHSYLWHRGAGRVRVTLSEDEVVYLELNTGRAVARSEGEPLTGERLEEAKAEAIKAFNNDSFWAFAPFKVLDPGARRLLVRAREGAQLLVTYDSGGSTPGDSYLWRLDEAGRPVAWRMWVSVIPRGGLEASWAGWRQTRAGAWVATEHSALGLTLEVKGLALTRRFDELEDLDPLLIKGW